jgi:hypothetical protein
MAPRTLTAQQLAWLQTRKKALAPSPGGRTALVREIVDTARVLHTTGTGYPELARALEVATELLLAWIDDHTAKPVPRELPEPMGARLHRDPRPGGNDFTTEIAALRQCMDFPFRLVEQVKVEFAELAASLDTHRPVAVHLTAHSVTEYRTPK